MPRKNSASITGKDRRVHTALKMHFIDGMTAQQIRDEFEERGIGDYTLRTIKDYINPDGEMGQARQEIIEQIDKKHAGLREKIIERQESAWQRARQAERDATRDEDVYAMKPETETNTSGGPMMVRDWRVLDEDEKPEGAIPEDTYIEFDDRDSTRRIQDGDEYYVAGLDGKPTYEKELVGVKRNQPDRVGQSYAREEQREHAETQAHAGGVFETNVNITGEVEQTVELEADQAAQAREFLKSFEGNTEQAKQVESSDVVDVEGGEVDDDGDADAGDSET